MLALILTHLAQLMKKLNVVDQTCQLSARRPEHAMVRFSGYALNGGKQTLKRGSLPHEGSAWVFTRPQDLMCLAKNDEFTGDAIKLVCFLDSLLLIL